jgi:hypothetical protein
MLDGRVLAPGTVNALGANLLVNGGAEAQYGWFQGAFPLIPAGASSRPFRVAPQEPGAPAECGQSCFAGGEGTLARAEQDDRSHGPGGRDRSQAAACASRLAGWLGTRKQSPATITCVVEFQSDQGRSSSAPRSAPVGLKRATRGARGRQGVPLSGMVKREATGRVRAARARRA